MPELLNNIFLPSSISLDPRKLVKLQIQTIREKCHLYILVLCISDPWSRSLRFTLLIVLFYVQIKVGR